MEQLKLSNGTFQSQSACVASTRLQGFACSAMDVSKQKSQRPGHLRLLIHLEELPRESSQTAHDVCALLLLHLLRRGELHEVVLQLHLLWTRAPHADFRVLYRYTTALQIT